MNNLRRGDLVFVHRTDTDLCYGGNGDKYARPAVVISNDKGNESNWNAVNVAYVTTKKDGENRQPFNVEIMCEVPSYVLCNQIATVKRDKVFRLVRTLKEGEMREVERGLKIALGLELSEIAPPSAA